MKGGTLLRDGEWITGLEDRDDNISNQVCPARPRIRGRAACPRIHVAMDPQLDTLVLILADKDKGV